MRPASRSEFEKRERSFIRASLARKRRTFRSHFPKTDRLGRDGYFQSYRAGITALFIKTDGSNNLSRQGLKIYDVFTIEISRRFQIRIIN